MSNRSPLESLSIVPLKLPLSFELPGTSFIEIPSRISHSASRSITPTLSMAYTERPCRLPGRDDAMPSVLRVTNHPLLKGVEGVRKVYVGYMRTDWNSMRSQYEFERGLTRPQGDVSELTTQGLLELHPGDYFFLRDVYLSEDPEDDVLATMVTGSMHHERDERLAFDNATQRILGPRGDRDPDTTAFEATGCARRVNGARAYTIGSSVQQLRKVVAPNASLNETQSETWDDYQGMAKQLVDSISSMLLNVQDALPRDCREAFAADSELGGQPSLGKKGVHGITAIQANISAAGVSSSDVELAALGEFGRVHYDPLDSPDHFTTVFSNPDVPRSYRPGIFHILHLGTFIVQAKYVGITFSGRRRHVGTSPTAPQGSVPVPSAYRFNAVCYSKAAAVDGTSRFTLASVPGKPVTQPVKSSRKARDAGSRGAGSQPLYVTPEMMNQDGDIVTPNTTNHTTFASNGHTIMDRESHVGFIGRSLHLVNTHVWRQLPPQYEIEVDTTKVMEAISYKNELGERVRLSAWPSAPNVRTTSEQRLRNEKVWTAYQEKVRRFIPHVASRIPSA